MALLADAGNFALALLFMFRKILRRGFKVLGLIAVLAIIGLVGLYFYISANYERIIQDAVRAEGVELTYKKLTAEWWQDFPEISIRVDSLELRDTNALTTTPSFLVLDTLRFDLSIAAILNKTIQLRQLDLMGGKFHLERDTAGAFNIGDLFGEKPPRDTNGFAPRIDWSRLQVNIKRLDVFHRDPQKRKLIEFHLRDLRVSNDFTDYETLLLHGTLDAEVAGVALNTDKGSYLTDTPVKGDFTVGIGKDTFKILPTTVQVGNQYFDFSADISRQQTPSIFYLACEHLNYDLTRAILHDQLRKKLADYHVEGLFPVVAEITVIPQVRDPEINVDFRFDGQQVRILDYVHKEVQTKGTFFNRLSVAEGGIAGSRKNIKFEMDSLRSFLGGMLIEMPYATLGGTESNTILRAPITVSGPATSLSRQLQNRDFLFKSGRFQLNTEVNASLDDLDELIASSDGRLLLSDLSLFYRPAGINLSFSRIDLEKIGKDVQFKVNSRPLSTGFSFQLAGQLDNLTPLLLDRPGEALNSNVALYSPRIDWTDFLSFFGEDGYFDTADEDAKEDVQVQESMRKTLLGLKRTFNPKIEAHFDTLAYYDIFSLSDFTTGLHFTKDTLVLERTTFAWFDSQLDMGAKLDFSQTGFTPFVLSTEAEHLNLNKLRPALNYFGFKLPRELDSLPTDLNISLRHLGRLDDSIGVMPGYNAGQLVFDDGYGKLFSGRMNYAPGPKGISSRFDLRGDPQIVNVLFGAKDFFFGTGHFQLNLGVESIPENLSQLVRNGQLRLQVDSSRIEYRPAEVYLRVQHFAVDVIDGHTDFQLRFLTDSTRHSVKLNGKLDDLSAFLDLEEAGGDFKVAANLQAPFLQWADFRDMFQSMNTEANADHLKDQSIFATTEGVFRNFRPDLRLTIDTFQLKNKTQLTEISTHLQLHDSLGLLIDEAGFKLGEGSVRFSAQYGLEKYKNKPFKLDLDINKLDLGQLNSELSALQISKPEGLTNLRGQLNMTGSLTSQLDEKNQRILFDSTRGKLSFQLQDLELWDSPFLAQIGRKAVMKKRFKHLRFAPLAGEIVLDSGLFTLPLLEIQNTGAQFFVEGGYHLRDGADLLISLPLRNIGRGVMDTPPSLTGYAKSGWKLYLVMERGKDGQPKTKLRLGRRRFFKKRNRLEEFKTRRRQLREERRQ